MQTITNETIQLNISTDIHAVDHNGELIPAIIRIPYRNYEISISTICRLPELAIFEKNNKIHGIETHFPFPTIESVLEAIKHIDKLCEVDPVKEE